jgi:glycosyltransferase involved in cell wall biosynthesis
METGGVQKVLLNILNNLNREKFQITLLLNLYQGKLLRDIPKDIQVHYIGRGKEFMSSFLPVQKMQLVLRWFKLKFYNKYPSLLYKKQGLYDQDVEIAFFHYNYDEVLNSPNKESMKIGWMHGDIKNITILGDKKEFVSRFLEFDKMIYVSYQTLASAESFNPGVINNAKVIYNPIEVEEIIAKSLEKGEIEISSSKKDNITSFISIGRVNPGKGYQLLLEVHKKLIDNGLFHKIYVIGEGYLRPELEKRIKEYKVENTFIFLGEYENPYPYVKQSDYFVLPSFSEAYPLVIAESLILEKPIITTDVGGISEMMIDGENGIFVQSKDEQGLYNAMKFLLENEENAKKFMENNKKCKNYFNPDKIYREIEIILSKK